MADGLRVRIVRDMRTDNFDLYFLERTSARTTHQLFPDGAGSWRREPISNEGGRFGPPSLSFNEENGREILQSLAEQLAQHGFVQLNAAPQMGAMQAHINDLQIQGDRLFSLAKGKE